MFFFLMPCWCSCLFCIVCHMFCSFYHYLIVSYTQLCCLLILHVHHLVPFFGVLIYGKTKAFIFFIVKPVLFFIYVHYSLKKNLICFYSLACWPRTTKKPKKITTGLFLNSLIFAKKKFVPCWCSSSFCIFCHVLLFY